MYNSIQQFIRVGLPQIDRYTENFFAEPTTLSDYVCQVKQELLQLATAIIAETLTEFNEMLCESHNRKKRWNIVRTDHAQLLTSIGNVCFEKTLFIEKKTGKREYLLNTLVGLQKHERMTEDALACILEEAVQTSYRKGGEQVSLTDQVSKQTVKNKIHQLQFPKMKTAEAEKRKVKYLFIEADEDHVALQHKESKKERRHIAKLVYVHEGYEEELGTSGRKRLKNRHAFSGLYEGYEENVRLWQEVNTYLEDTYDMEAVEKIFVSGDGGAWIDRSEEVLGKKVHMLLDEFHLRKYMNNAVKHLGDSQQDGAKQLKHLIKRGGRKDTEKYMDLLLSHTNTKSEYNMVAESKRYIINNWKKITAKRGTRRIVPGCSAEGHVSHILSARLSSRPMGWSKRGLDQMCKLRAYWMNGGDLYALAKYQKEEVIDEQEEVKAYLSQKEMFSRHGEYYHYLEKYAEKMAKSFASTKARKAVSAHLHLAGL